MYTTDSTNKFVQGSVWRWESDNEIRSGVQSSERPVLVISNNLFNRHSPVVNCVSITSSLKDSPVHVPVFVAKDSHIQCEQLHTIPKDELVEFLGVVPPPTLNNVKAKLKIQFDMSPDKNTAILVSIKKNIEEMKRKFSSENLANIETSLAQLNEKAEKGFGVPEIEDTFLQKLADLHKSFADMAVRTQGADPVAPVPTSAKPSSAFQQVEQKLEQISLQKPVRRTRQVHRKYTDADLAFIADESNSIEDMMARFDYKDKPAAYAARTYLRRKYAKTLQDRHEQ